LPIVGAVTIQNADVARINLGCYRRVEPVIVQSSIIKLDPFSKPR
jgi:hypothetical protein